MQWAGYVSFYYLQAAKLPAHHLIIYTLTERSSDSEEVDPINPEMCSQSMAEGSLDQ